MERGLGALPRDSTVTEFGLLSDEASRRAGCMLASWRAQAGMAGGAARRWEDPGAGEEPVAGV